MATTIPAPSVGRCVHVGLVDNERRSEVQYRAATVVRTWHGGPDAPSATVNVELHLDGANDWNLVNPQTGQIFGSDHKGKVFLTSVGYDADGAVGKWRYPPPETRKIEA